MKASKPCRIFSLEDSFGRRSPAARLSSFNSCLKAFTLIEIMISITIFGVVLIAIYSSWSSILRGSKVGLSVAAEAQRSRMALRALGESLGSAQLFTANIRYYQFIADTSSDFAQLSFVARLPSSFPGSGLFGDQVVRRVTFGVEQNQLVLTQSPLLESEERNVKPYTIVMAPNVSRFQLEFFDTNKFKWLPEWLPTNQLPKMVRVALGFRNSSRGHSTPEDVVVQTVFLSSLAVPRDLQVPAIRRGAGGVPPGPQGGVPPTVPAQVLQPGGPGVRR